MKYELSRIGTLTEVARELGLTYGRSAQLIKAKDFPPPIGVFGKLIRVWDLDCVQEWGGKRLSNTQNRRKSQIKIMLESLNDELAELEE